MINNKTATACADAGISADGAAGFLARLGQRNAEVQRQANRFRQVIGLPLSKFWHPLTGFDIVRFDDVIKPARNQSLRACVKAKYGQEAVQFIESLIRA
jgi:hypothetical protein